jgi:trehalose-6-phosphate synthase
MPLDERVERHGKLFETLKRNDVAAWGDRFLATLTETRDVSRPRATAADPQAWTKSAGLARVATAMPHLTAPAATGLSSRR